MRKIGLLSDTHGFLDDAVFKHFENCDEIWHAGDFGNLEIVGRLSRFKSFRGVWGNIDDKAIRMVCPEHQRFQCEDVDVWITHIGGYPGRYSSLIKDELVKNPPKLFICGHSHILKVQYDPKYDLLHINPGAAGKVGWHTVRTLVRFDIDRDKVSNLQVIEIGPR
ncbi:metallophosphoesterase family protein [Sphingobacterium shayense]|uniref:metallophosphoesterase family protein n=1 Tax=Sphingobacterium shayense TaxID=626343 RepID=UPI0015570E16|nr:metallophosphoesterase family protein [Sphingobacterium shayense]NQD69132.1 metallophosphoesterase family protein [Sphingobacterium shayense]